MGFYKDFYKWYWNISVMARNGSEDQRKNLKEMKVQCLIKKKNVEGSWAGLGAAQSWNSNGEDNPDVLS